MPPLDPLLYGPTVAAFLDGLPPAPLDVGPSHEPFRPALAALTPESLFAASGLPVRDVTMARCCLAGLWLRHNFFDESHAISQDIATPTGSFWHAILHRREPDYGNARYWFRRVGPHPIYPALNEAAMAAGWPTLARWDPLLFLGRVEQALHAGPKTSEAQLCRTVQHLEWKLLFDFSWRSAVGES